MDLKEVDRRWGASARKWVWSTQPQFVFEEDGSDRTDLEPVEEIVPDDYEDEVGWWTCHPDTHANDLAVIYRSRGQGSREPFPVVGPKDLCQVVLATSPAFPLKDDPLAGEFTGYHGCRMVVVSTFDPPVPIKQLRGDPVLRDWGALKAGFVKAALPMPDEVWRRLIEIDSDGPADTSSGRWQQGPRRSPNVDLEQRLETWLEGHPHALELLGYRLRVIGRQVWCKPGHDGTRHDGTIDLLCQRLDRKDSYVIVELKVEELRRDAIAQTLGYIGWLREQPGVQEVHGLVIGLGKHAQVPWVLKTLDGLVNTAHWAKLGLPDHLREELGIRRLTTAADVGGTRGADRA